MAKSEMRESDFISYLHNWIEKLGYFNALIIGSNEVVASYLGLRIAELMELCFSENQKGKRDGEVFMEFKPSKIISIITSMNDNDVLLIDTKFTDEILEGITYALRENKNLILLARKEYERAKTFRRKEYERVKTFRSSIDHVFTLQKIQANYHEVSLNSSSFKDTKISFNPPSEELIDRYNTFRLSYLTF